MFVRRASGGGVLWCSPLLRIGALRFRRGLRHRTFGFALRSDWRPVLLRQAAVGQLPQWKRAAGWDGLCRRPADLRSDQDVSPLPEATAEGGGAFTYQDVL